MMVTSERGERDLSKGEEERAEASYMERDWRFRASGVNYSTEPQ